jgi:hypothetical protein
LFYNKFKDCLLMVSWEPNVIYGVIFRLSIDFHDFLNAFRCSQAWVLNNTQSCSYKGWNKVSLPFRSTIFAIGNSYPRCENKSMQTKRLLLARDKSNAQFVLSQCVFYALGISRSVHVKDNLQQFLMNNVLYNVQRFFMDGPFRAK